MRYINVRPAGYCVQQLATTFGRPVSPEGGSGRGKTAKYTLRCTTYHVMPIRKIIHEISAREERERQKEDKKWPRCALNRKAVYEKCTLILCFLICTFTPFSLSSSYSMHVLNCNVLSFQPSTPSHLHAIPVSLRCSKEAIDLHFFTIEPSPV